VIGIIDPIVNGAVTLTNSADIQWFGTVRGRVGALVNPTTFVYGTGGLAYGGISASGTFSNSLASRSASFGDSTTEVGWTLGVGVEGAIPNTSNWTWKLEYLYIDFGTISGNGVTPFGEPYSWSMRVTDNILRVGFNYRFY
jgi:outer membrane immunogenic protein